MNFHHCKNYGQKEPVNKAILIFNQNYDLCGFRDEETRYVFLNGFSQALSEERSIAIAMLNLTYHQRPYQ
jgi:hypothetical protein